MARKNYSKELKARVALDALKGHKTVGEIASEYSIHPNQVCQWKKKALAGMAELFSRGKSNEVEDFESERDRLYRKVGQLQVEVDWLKKSHGADAMSVSGKRSCIAPAHKALSTSRQCALIELPRSGYYRPGLQGESAENLALMRLIDEEYMRHPFYGVRKIVIWLYRQGHDANRKRIQRLMRLMGIASIAPKPNTSKAFPEHKKYPHLLNGLDINHPKHVWCSDITYIRMRGGFVYLTAVMDWHSRFVLSWEVLSVTMNDDFCVSALTSAIRRHGKPEIFNTDQGVQFTGKAFTNELKENGIKISMDLSACAHAQAVCWTASQR